MLEFFASVTAAEFRRLEEFLGALRTKCEAVMNPCSEFKSEAFESEFRSKLLAHHCFVGSPLFQESFDSAFIAACKHSGHTVEKAPDGQRFWDVKVNGRKISLKSSKAKSLKENRLHISKLTETAWIQDCRTPKRRREETFALFTEYCEEVDAIIQLRYFHAYALYEMVEIPVHLFRQVFDLELASFQADGPTINIPVGKEPPDFTLKLDRSDAKITVANIDKSLCTVHGTWRLGKDF